MSGPTAPKTARNAKSARSRTKALWRLQSQLKHETEWTYHEVPDRSDLEELREILWRKYQRRRASYEDVLLADKMLAGLGDG